MLSLGDLFNPLALTGQCPDLARRQVLMRSVLQVMTGGTGPWPHHDPVWATLLPLIPQGTRRNSIPPHDPQHLTLTAPVNVAPDQLGQLVTLPWMLGGDTVPVLGEVIWHQPLTLHVSREGYQQTGQAIPAFLRAYDGLCILGVKPAQAQTLVEHSPGDLLLDIVTFTYRRRDQVQYPAAYVRTLLARHLAPRTHDTDPSQVSNCGHHEPLPLSHWPGVPSRSALPS